MTKRMTDKTPAFMEDFNLGADETLDEFQGRMFKAVEAHFAPKVHWFVEAIGDGWLVVGFVHNIDDDIRVDRFRVVWTQDGAGEISLGASEKVKRRVVFEPDPDEPASEAVIDLADLTESHGAGTKFSFGGLRDTLLLEDVKVYDFQEGKVQQAAPFEVTEADFTSPSGEKYIAVMVGHGAAHSVININERLYDLEGEEGQPGMRQNVEDQQAMIEAAFKARKASMGSQLDHPNPSDGPGFRGLATELIDAKIDGVRVAIKEGVLGTSEGQNLKVAAAHGFPIGKSTLARGAGERRVMDKENPLYSQNTERLGKLYNHIFGFVIEQYDTVRHPSASVFAKVHHAEQAREVRDAFDALLCDDGTCPIGGKCPDGSTPRPEGVKLPAITIPEPELNKDQETQMDEAQVKKLIADAVKGTNEAHAEQTAELTSKVDALGEKQAATETALGETQGKLAEAETSLVEAKEANTKLVDDLRDAKTVAVAAGDAIAAATAERDAISLDKQIAEAVNGHCQAKLDDKEHGEIEPINRLRKDYLTDAVDRFDAPEFSDEDADGKKTPRAATAEEMAEAVTKHIEAYSTRFDKGPGAGIKEMHEAAAANKRRTTPLETGVRHESTQGFSGSGVLPFALTQAPAKATPKA